MTIDDMIDLIDSTPPGPWPDGWATWANVIEAHQQMVERFISTLKPNRESYPLERGIVIAGGGLKYFPSVWVNVNLLRHFGCQLPIQLWYLGDSEMDPYMKRLLEPLGVECIDARKLEPQYPARILCGWELKLYATLHSPFAQALFLDADNGVVCDPTYLFSTPEFEQHGAIFWPDYACWTLKPGVWKVFGMLDMAEVEVAQAERAFESGQYLIDKRQCDRELRLAMWYAEHSDFTFRHVYGDKECFHLAWRKLSTEYAMPKAGPGWNEHTIVQFDFRNQIIFQHRCQDKWRFGGNRMVKTLANEAYCFDLVRELSQKWSGTLWRNDNPTEQEQSTIASLAGRRALYRRVGYDERTIKLDQDRQISEGEAECERLWHINHVDDEPVLTISRLDRPTCHLKRDGDGTWRGTWLDHERMPIELIPYVQWQPTQEVVKPQKPRLVITVAIGRTFQEIFERTGRILEDYARRCNADFVVLTNPTQTWWGLEKFRIRQFASQYDRTLYLDADVLLRGSMPNLFDLVPAGHVAMHDDWPHLPSYDWLFSERKRMLESQDVPMDTSNTTWNTGIVLCDREHADLWTPPREPFMPTHCAEQFWVEHNARRFPFFELPTSLNTQYWMPNFEDLLPTAHAIHLSNCPNEQRLAWIDNFLNSSVLESTRN
jgi:hypothetical protein